MLDDLNSDLSTEAAEAFFEARDPSLAAAIKSMESAESWTKDRFEEVQVTLQEFAERIADADLEEVSPKMRSELIVLLGYISSGKAIKLLMWIESSLPNFVARTLAQAQMLGVEDPINNEACRLFVERFYVLERLQMLSRIYSEERLKIVQKVLHILAHGDDEAEED
jgi:intracellular multiplication protein IcmW